MNDQTRARRALWPWIVAVVIGVPVLYVLSLPAANWALIRYPSAWTADVIFGYGYPFRMIYQASSPGVKESIDVYIGLLIR